MKRIFYFLVVLAACSLITSCLKHDTGDSYYVRYEASYPVSKAVTLRIATPKGIQTLRTTIGNYSDEFGPVYKGFAASISSSESGALTISVRKNDGEYVKKSTGDTVANYTIDF